MDNIQQWVQAIQSETAALEFLKSLQEDLINFAPYKKNGKSHQLTTRSQLKKLGKQVGMTADYLFANVITIDRLVRLGFVLEINTVTEAF